MMLDLIPMNFELNQVNFMATTFGFVVRFDWVFRFIVYSENAFADCPGQ